MHDPSLVKEALAELPPDIAHSPLFNGDLAPAPKSRRTWSTYNFAALWISMAHCIPTYMLAGGLIAAGMNWWQALLTIGLGNTIVLIPILLNAHPGTKYGVPFPVLARSAFGTYGANVPAVLRAIVACGWFGIQTFIGGEAVKTFLVALWPAFGTLGGHWNIAGLSLSSAITFFLFWALNIFIIYRGMNAVRVFENWAAPIVLILAAALLGFVVWKARGVGTMLSAPSQFHTVGAFARVFVPSLTAMIGFWATLSLNIPDFTRFGRGQKEQMLGQALGLPTTMIAFSAMGVVITSASHAILHGVPVADLWDPVTILSHITSPDPLPGEHAPMIASGFVRWSVAIIALLGVGIATISVNIAANVVSPANDFANLAPRLISFKTGGLITGIVGVLMLPWKLMATAGAYIFTWLIGYSALLGPIAGIMIADYWIVRRTRLDVPDLYRPNGRYPKLNPVALVALFVGVLPNIPGFFKAAGLFADDPGFWAAVGAPFWDAIYVYAWFTGFIIAGVMYLVGSLIWRPEAIPTQAIRIPVEPTDGANPFAKRSFELLREGPDVDLVRFAADGASVICRVKEELLVLDAKSGTVLHTPSIGGSLAKHIAVAPDGSWIAGGLIDPNAIVLWNGASGALEKEIAKMRASALAWSADSKKLAIGGAGGEILVCDIGGDPIEIGTHTREIEGLAFAGDRLISASGTLKIWDIDAKKDLRTIEVPDPREIAVHGSTVAVACGDGRVRLFDFEGEPVREIEVGPKPIRLVAFSPDGKTIACDGGAQMDLRLFDVESGKPILTRPGHVNRYISFHPSESGVLVTACNAAKDEGGGIRLWKLPL